MAERCEQCLTEGITIVPARLGCSIDINESGIANLAYPQRLLREGYVYILDNNNKWYGYVVTEGRYLKAFTVTGVSGAPPYSKEPDLPYKDSTCLKGGNCTVLNSFIRIPNPNNDIETLWIAYSPVKWTKTVLDRHKKNTDSAKKNNMIEVSVSDTQSKSNTSLRGDKLEDAGGYDLWRYDPDGVGVKPIFSHHACEYFGIINPLTKAFYQPNKRVENDSLVKTLIKIEWDSIEKTGKENRVLNVFLDDKVGQLIDLNEFVFQLEDSIKTRYSLTNIHKLDVAYKIKGLESSIKSGIRTQVVNEYIEKKMFDQRGQYTTFDGSRGEDEKVDYKKKEAFRREIELTLIDQQEVMSDAASKAEESWENYVELYKKSEMEAFLTSGMGKKIQDDNSRILKTLLNKHQDIYESEGYRQQMLYNFDTQDIASGVSYLENILESIGITVNYPECIKRYANDISNKTLKEDNNFILRALVYNYQPVINAIIKEGEKNTPWAAVTQAAWSSIFNGGAAIYAFNIRRNSAASQAAVANLSAPLMQVLKEQANKSAVSVVPYAIGFHIQQKITRIDFTGRRHQAISLLSGLLDKESTSASNSTVNRFAISIINQLKVEGNAHFEKGVNGHMLALVDMEKAANTLNTLELPSTPTSQGKQERINSINESAKSALVSKGQVYNINSEEFKRFVDPHTKPLSPSANIAVFGSMFQIVACASLFYSAVDGSESTKSNGLARLIENSEGWARLAGGLGFLMGGALDNHADRLKIELTNTALSGEQVKTKKAQLGTFKSYAKGLNLGSGAIFAIFDAYHVYDETTKGNTDIAVLYGISAASGLGSVVWMGSTATLSALGMSMSWNYIGWALLAISIVTGIMIGFVSNNALEEWIENSIWGVDSLKLSYEADIQAFELAIQEYLDAEPSEETAESTGSQSASTTNSIPIRFGGEIPESNNEDVGYEVPSDKKLDNMNEDVGYEVSSDEELDNLLEDNESGTPEQNQRAYFSVLVPEDQQSSHGSDSNGGNLSPEVKKQLVFSRQNAAKRLENLNKTKKANDSYTKNIEEQNKKLEELRKRLEQLRSQQN